MAGQDFAHIKESLPEDVRPMGQSKVLLLTLLALAVVAGGFAVGFMVGQEMGMQKASSEDQERLLRQLKEQQQELANLRAAAKERLPDVSTTQVGELTFYNELPKQSVDPAPLNGGSSSTTSTDKRQPAADRRESGSSEALLKSLIENELKQAGNKPATSGTAAKKPEASDERYYLQLASFQKRADAENFYPKVTAAGFQGVIKRVELAKLGTWYRVYAGPFASKPVAEKARKSFKEKLKITGLVVQGD